MNRRSAAGFTLIEVLAAVGLLSIIALALAKTLVTSMRSAMASGRWIRATQLAAEGMERLRAGDAPTTVAAFGEFERQAAVTTWSGNPRLFRLEVSVTWNDGESHVVRLVSLARR
jgi:prepilin-type N-terminal cleavage/methylation domain-containing protein